jgi:hypothetical protein
LQDHSPMLALGMINKFLFLPLFVMKFNDSFMQIINFLYQSTLTVPLTSISSTNTVYLQSHVSVGESRDASILNCRVHVSKRV